MIKTYSNWHTSSQGSKARLKASTTWTAPGCSLYTLYTLHSQNHKLLRNQEDKQERNLVESC